MIDLLSNTFASAPMTLKVLMLFWIVATLYYVLKEDKKKKKND